MSNPKFSLSVRKLRARARHCAPVVYFEAMAPEAAATMAALVVAGMYKTRRDDRGQLYAYMAKNRRPSRAVQS